MMPQAARLTESSLAEFTTPTKPYESDNRESISSEVAQQTPDMTAYQDQHRFRSVDPNKRPPRPFRQPAQQAAPPIPKGVEDIRQTKAYKTAARRWLSTIVALPIAIVSSWVLYERLYGNKSPRRLPRQEEE